MTSALPSPSSPLPRRKLPIGLQTLREIREQGHYYADKTGLAMDLIESRKAYFLSRPGRFGKSLLVARACTTRSTCCCCSRTGRSSPTGSRRARRPSWSGCWRSGSSSPRT